MKSMSERLRRQWPFFAPSRAGFVLAGLCTVVVASTEPMIPWLMRELLNRGFQTGFALWQVPVAVIGLFTVRGFASFTAQYSLAWVAYRGTQLLRTRLFERLMNAHPSLYTKQSASTLINTVAFEAQTGAVQLTSSGLSLVRDVMTLVALMVSLLIMNWKLTLFIAVLAPAVAFVMRTLSRRLHKLTVANQGATDQLAYSVEENVLAWRIVRLHGAQRQQVDRFSRMSDQMRVLSLKGVAAAATMTPMTQILAAISLSAVIVTALWTGGKDPTSVGDFVAFVMAMLLLIAPIKRLSEVAVPITRGLASLDRAVDLIDEAPVETDGAHAPARAQGEIVLDRVTVQYHPEQPPAIAELDLHIPAGQVVALVGPSGAGKSTLINLLPRFVDPTAGRVLIDGHELPQWHGEALRRQFALVSQDVVLFNDSIAANVALGQPLDREKVREALRAANLLDHVDGLPEGMDTVVGHNGQRLSGGQRQRLAIARAIYKDAPILILDEATSALDSESERLVQAALDKLMAGRTSIVIAHRLSTIERADRVVVMEAGRIVEQGTHAELLAKGGLFARLHALQFQT